MYCTMNIAKWLETTWNNQEDKRKGGEIFILFYDLIGGGWKI